MVTKKGSKIFISTVSSNKLQEQKSIGYYLSVARKKLAPGLAARLQRGHSAPLILVTGGFFMSIVLRLSMVVEQGAFGLAVLCDGLLTCSTAIFRLAAGKW